MDELVVSAWDAEDKQCSWEPATYRLPARGRASGEYQYVNREWLRRRDVLTGLMLKRILVKTRWVGGTYRSSFQSNIV